MRNAFVLMALSATAACSFARPNLSLKFTEDDFALYPQFCRARIAREPQSLVDYWNSKLGPKNFLHMHHYCFGLKALNLGFANFGNKQSRGFMANEAINNFEYVLAATEKTFYMRPDVFLNMGRGYQLKQEYDLAKNNYEAALKFNPMFVDAWVYLSDMYYQLGKKSEALSVLEKARSKIGENKKIDLRIADIRKSGVKSAEVSEGGE